MYVWGYYDHHVCELGGQPKRGQEKCFSKTLEYIVTTSSIAVGCDKNSLIADVDGDHILLSFEGYAWDMSPLLMMQRRSADSSSSSSLRGDEDASHLQQTIHCTVASSVDRLARCSRGDRDTMDQATPSVASSSGSDLSRRKINNYPPWLMAGAL